MKDILEEILAYKRKEVEREKAELPPEQLFALVEDRLGNAHNRRNRNQHEFPALQDWETPATERPATAKHRPA